MRMHTKLWTCETASYEFFKKNNSKAGKRRTKGDQVGKRCKG